MKVTIGYGKDEKFDVEISDKQLIGVYNPKSIPKIDYHDTINDGTRALLQHLTAVQVVSVL